MSPEFTHPGHFQWVIPQWVDTDGHFMEPWTTIVVIHHGTSRLLMINHCHSWKLFVNHCVHSPLKLKTTSNSPYYINYGMRLLLKLLTFVALL